MISLMSFLVAGGVCLLSSDHPDGDYPDVFPGGWWRMPPEFGSP